MTTQLALSIVIRGNEVLLGHKKIGFGAGYWNAFGGKVEPGETVEEGARRELLEEAGIEWVAGEPRGLLTCSFTNGSQLDIHLFVVTDFRGEPVETEEMHPAWVSLAAVPYDAMWPADRLWFPAVLAGNTVQARITYDDSHAIIDSSIAVT